MQALPERVRAFLDSLEAERLAALALSEQKAEEAKLIKARQEGFQAALDMLKGEIAVRQEKTNPKPPGRRRGRRPIPQMILRELSFSGQPMTAAQIARAIEYNHERTETALKRMEKDGQVVRNEAGRWAIGLAGTPQINALVPGAGNGMPAE